MAVGLLPLYLPTSAETLALEHSCRHIRTHTLVSRSLVNVEIASCHRWGPGYVTICELRGTSLAYSDEYLGIVLLLLYSRIKAELRNFYRLQH